MSKPVVATTQFAGCFGCHMSILDIDEKILDLIELVEFNASPINDIKHISKPVDIGLIEGGCSNTENVQVLHEFRKNCKILVSFGECAIMGGLPSMRNGIPVKECLNEAFLLGPSVTENHEQVMPNDEDIPILLDRIYPNHEIVKIDYFLPGCPPRAGLIWETLVALINGREADLPYEVFKFD